jgi:drug/metabolite transporter (DMT)-like permease
VDPVTLLTMRMLYALPFFIAMVWWAQLREPLRLTGGDLGQLAVVGFFGYYASSYADFSGLQYISAALERVVLYTYPAITVLFLAIAARARPAPAVLGAMGLTYIGVALAVLHDAHVGGSRLGLGVGLVFISALSYAIYLYKCEPLLRRLGALRVTGLATGLASLMVIAQYLVLRPVKAISTQPWQVQACAAGMAIFCTAVPIWLYGIAIRRIGAGRAAIVATTGPVFTLLLAWALLGEALTLSMLAGAALVIVGVGLISRR